MIREDPLRRWCFCGRFSDSPFCGRTPRRRDPKQTCVYKTLELCRSRPILPSERSGNATGRCLDLRGAFINGHREQIPS